MTDHTTNPTDDETDRERELRERLRQFGQKAHRKDRLAKWFDRVAGRAREYAKADVFSFPTYEPDATMALPGGRYVRYYGPQDTESPTVELLAAMKFGQALADYSREVQATTPTDERGVIDANACPSCGYAGDVSHHDGDGAPVLTCPRPTEECGVHTFAPGGEKSEHADERPEGGA